MTAFKYNDQEIIDMIKREDYYTVLKNRRTPEDSRENRWLALKTKFTILNRNGKL